MSTNPNNLEACTGEESKFLEFIRVEKCGVSDQSECSVWSFEAGFRELES